MIKQLVLVGILLAAITSITGLEQQNAFARSHHHGSGESEGGMSSSSDNSGQTSTSDNTNGNSKLLCYAAGGILLLGGVPAPQVFAAGSAAHNAGVCPQASI